MQLLVTINLVSSSFSARAVFAKNKALKKIRPSSVLQNIDGNGARKGGFIVRDPKYEKMRCNDAAHPERLIQSN